MCASVLEGGHSRNLASVGRPSGCLGQPMTNSPTTPSMRRRDTYEGYALGCATAWALILLIARRRTDRETQKTLAQFCGGWWGGWISATIARALYPPPKRLEPEAYNRLVEEADQRPARLR